MAIPILMYHNVAEVPGALHLQGCCLYVTPEAFAAQMNLLARRPAWLSLGDGDARVAMAARDAGLVASPTARRARRGMDLFMLPCVAIDHADSLAKFALRAFTPLEDLRAA